MLVTAQPKATTPIPNADLEATLLAKPGHVAMQSCRSPGLSPICTQIGGVKPKLLFPFVTNGGKRFRALPKAAFGTIVTRVSDMPQVQTVDAQEGMQLLSYQGWKFLDLRDAKSYDNEHLTKPPRCSVNVPLPAGGASALPGALETARVGKSQKLLVASTDGTEAPAAAAAIAAAGWTDVAIVEGGYAGWRRVWTTSGRKVMPQGRWVASGTEALKSGLNVGGAAMAYEERINVDKLTQEKDDPGKDYRKDYKER
eukprot:gnl/MRDRNA2_/MRDRNA2_68848_c0_seq1.p1 gnl/MRDRNA2_/MRDRNA2_68848_c0~~gnl/MRDRNA2_/MRDRNA2_68848_c0_seq1.p1  ORF type:complete len:272 (+),score=52.03 gnl/MRDRNA2_/MRDRNA2_68848_c0_seq1:54-818(+)